MTKITRPEDRREIVSTDSELRSSLRERVRQHLLTMAPLAIVAATPLTNTACDPAPLPAECIESGWTRHLSGQADWSQDHGHRIILLKITSNFSDIEPPSSYSIEGGSFLTTGKSETLKILPDADAKVITLEGKLRCMTASESLRLTIDLEPRDSADEAPTVTISR